jgi:hypothetical protein
VDAVFEVFAIAAIAVSVLAVRRVFLRRKIGSFWNIQQQLGIALVLAGLATVVVAATKSFAASPAIIALPLLAAIAAYDSADSTSFRYLGISISESFRHLPITLRSPHAFKAATAYIRSYFSRFYLIASCGVLVAAPLSVAGWLPPGYRGIGAGAGCVMLGLMIAVPRRRTPQRELSGMERKIALAPDTVARHPLRCRNRPGTFELSEQLRPSPKTILLIILESAGSHFPSSQDSTLLLADRIRHASGVFDAWVAPGNAISNSTCTDVVLPSILTGAGPHESSAKLHRLPFLFDIASARGYRTALFTSASLDWADLNSFFAGARIDMLFSAETANLPYANDLAIDDHIAARKLAEWLDASSAPSFAVLYSNALHVPFQRDSEIPIPDTITTPRDRATYIVEKQLELLFETLRARGRFDDSLVLVVGDHGETIGGSDKDNDPSPIRVTTLSDEFTRPLFLIKPPSDLRADLRATLRQNAGRLIGHIDIAPTIADLLGATLVGDLAYAGQSLLRPLADDRILYVLNTNEWRAWPRSAVGIFRGRSSAIIDYLDDRLCRCRAADQGAQFARDALLEAGIREPLVQRALARIYKDRLGLRS